MKNEFSFLVTKLMLTVGLITGASGAFLDQVDLILGICMKSLSIISFVIVISINWNRFRRTVKIWLGK